jgi:hypothetical protein
MDNFRSLLSFGANSLANWTGSYLEEETKLILPQLIKINCNGFLTSSSQPGEMVEEFHTSFPIQVPHPNNVVFSEPKKIIYQQRASIMGFMARETAREYQYDLQTSEYLIFVEEINREVERMAEDTNIPIIPLSMSLTDDLEHQHIFSGVRITGYIGLGELRMLADEASIDMPLDLDLVWVVIIDPIWGRPTDLFDMLSDSMEESVGL